MKTQNSDPGSIFKKLIIVDDQHNFLKVLSSFSSFTYDFKF